MNNKTILLIIATLGIAGLFFLLKKPKIELPAGLISRWKFDNGTANDSVGGNHGTLMDGAYIENGALVLNGIDNYVEVPHHTDFSFEGAPFSISLWVNCEDISFFPIIRKGVIGTDAEYCLAIAVYRHAIDFCLYDKDDQTRFISQGNGTTLAADRWYHIVVTYDGGILYSGIKIYLDGVRDGSGIKSQFDFAAMGGNHAIWIGRGDTTTSSEYANGKIDDVMIFNRALSPDEILSLYNSY